MKGRFPAYMCDSLGDSNQAGVHFLGIGSQLGGAGVPQVIKHSQPVINCTNIITANIPEQKKTLPSSKEKRPRDFAPYVPFMELMDCQESACKLEWQGKASQQC